MISNSNEQQQQQYDDQTNWLHCANCLNGLLEYKDLCFLIDTDGVFLEILKDINCLNRNRNRNNNNNNNGADIRDQLPNHDRYQLVIKPQTISTTTSSGTTSPPLYYQFDWSKHDIQIQKPYIQCSNKECKQIIGYYHLNQSKKIFSFRIDHETTFFGSFCGESNPWKHFLNKPEVTDNIQLYKNKDSDYIGFFSTNYRYITSTNSSVGNIIGSNNISPKKPLQDIESTEYMPTVYPNINQTELPKFKDGVDIKVRDYQVESYYECITNNTLLVLPTGMGKTLVSIMVLLEMYKLNQSNHSNINDGSQDAVDDSNKNSKRVALFLVDRVALVEQQSVAIERDTGLKVFKLYGEINDGKKRNQLKQKNYDVLCCTVGSLVNLLSHEFVNIQDYYFITFDEVHNASGTHDFNKIIDFIKLSPIPTRPRILGLSASLISITTVVGSIASNTSSSIESAKNSIFKIEKLMLSQVFKPSTLMNQIDEIKPDLLSYSASVQENSIESKIINFLVKTSSTIQKQVDYSDVNLDSINSGDLNFIKALEKFQKYCTPPTSTLPTTASIDIGHLIELYKLLLVLSTEGPKQTISKFDNLINTMEPNDNLFNSFESLKHEIITRECNNDTSALEKGSTRFNCLLKSLKSALNSNGDNIDLRIIVFVETRIGAENLTVMLKKEDLIQTSLNVKKLIGQSGSDGMNSEKQQRIISKFKSGYCKLIVCTSVLEEGIDISNVSMVVCYDGIPSLKSLIQRRGRARASKDKSKFIIIYNEKRELKMLEILSSENLLNNSINQIIMERNKDVKANYTQKLLNWKNVHKVIDEINVNLETTNTTTDYVILSLYHLNDHFQTLYDYFDNFHWNSFSILNIEQVVMKIDDEDQYLSNFIMVTLAVNVESNRLTAINEFKSLLEGNGYNFWLLDQSFYLSNNNNNLNQQQPLHQQTFIYTILRFDYGNMINPTTFNRIDGLDHQFQMEFKKKACIMEFISSDSKYKLILPSGEIETNYLCMKDPDYEEYLNIFFIAIRPLVFEERNDFRGKTYYNKSVPVKSNFGESFVYRLILSTKKNDIPKLLNLLQENGFKMYDCNITISNILYNHHGIINLELPQLERNKPIKYLVQCLNSQRSYGRVIDQSFVNKINDLLSIGQIEECDFILNSLISNKTKFLNYIEFVQDNLKIFKNDPYYEKKMKLIVGGIGNGNSNNINEGDHSWVREVYITPSRKIFIQPTLQRSNRATRRFGMHNFIVVKFADEQFISRSLGVNPHSPIFDKLIKHTFENGITVNGELFKFVGNSNSQLKEYSSWFVKINQSINVNIVRQWTEIGHIDNPRKYFRCLGLMFSTTIPTIRIAQYCLSEIADIYRNKHNFTEGCGEIGIDLSKQLNETYGFKSTTCAYQIRIGGAKGMLVVNNKLPNPMGIYLRPSMVKFNTSDSDTHRTLEICSISTTSTCKLNRQVISLLSTLGTKDSVFFSLQDRYLNQLATIVNDANTSRQLISEFFPLDISESELYQDSFIRRILISLYKLKMERVQQKCHIEVKNSRTLLGVCDPTNHLPENSVFVQLEEDDPLDSTRKVHVVVTGLVMVIKNPCTHPGDVRYLQAVNIPSLHHLHNVLVFSTNGPVPNFKEISGSDLDGDRYFFCYDKDLIGSRRVSLEAYLGEIGNTSTNNNNNNNRRRNNNTSNNNDNVYGDSNLLNEIYFDNIQRQQLGSMYNTHLAICDLFGALHETAIQISKECFKEIDYPKTGIHGSIPKDAFEHIQKKGQPHYMQRENSKKNYYQSKKVMGLMYDQIEQLVYIGDFLPSINVDESKLIDGYKHYLKDAQLLYKQYKSQIQSLLTRFKAASEELLLIGFFDSSVAGYSSSSFGKLSKDVKIEMKSEYKKIKQQFEIEFFKQFSERDQQESIMLHKDEINKKVAAWYYVSYGDNDVNSGGKALGFYWVARSFKQVSTDQDTQKRRNIMVNSILDHMEQKRITTLQFYGQRLSIVNELNDYLVNTLKDSFFGGLSLQIIGSTATLLFNQDSFNDCNSSDLNLYLHGLNGTDLSKIEKQDILKQLYSEIKCQDVLEKVTNCKEININDTIPTFKFKMDGINITISLETSHWSESLVQQQYINNDPSILSLLFCIMDWGVKSFFIPSELSKSFKTTIKTEEEETLTNLPLKDTGKNLTKSNMFSLFINFCIDTKLIEKFNKKEFINNSTIVKNSNLQVSNMEKLIEISSRYYSVENNNNVGGKRNKNNGLAVGEYSTSNLGDTILSFFRYYSDIFGSKVYENSSFTLKSFIKDNFKVCLNTNIDSDKSTLLFYQDSFRHALHSLSTFISVNDFLKNCFKTTKKTMKLTDHQLNQIREDPEVSREIIKKVQLCGCSIFINIAAGSKNASIEIEAKHQQLREAENEIRSILSIKHDHHQTNTNINSRGGNKRGNKRGNNRGNNNTSTTTTTTTSSKINTIGDVVKVVTK